MDVLLLAPGRDTASRVPVLSCADALRRGAHVEVVTLESDADVDACLDRLPGAGRGDAGDAAGAGGVEDAGGVATADVRLVVAGGDGPLRGVLRRMVRRVLPRGGLRPPGLPDDRTVSDLPPVGVLPLDPASGTDGVADLASRLGLPRGPADVAAAVLGGRARRVDLLRHDGGSVTLHGALLGAADEQGRPLGWRARIDVDDVTLSDGTEALLACAVANADGYATVGGLPLVATADPADGLVDVGLALPAGGRRGPEIEVRRARGRAVAVTLLSPEVPVTDDGVHATLTRGRTWWVERAAWGVYTG